MLYRQNSRLLYFFSRRNRYFNVCDYHINRRLKSQENVLNLRSAYVTTWARGQQQTGFDELRLFKLKTARFKTIIIRKYTIVELTWAI